MRAVILAAGFGKRLWPLTEDRTKPAIPFLNQPLIAYSVEYLATYGIREIIVNLHHKPESIRRALGDGSRFGVRIHYSYEEEILGTSGALDRVRDALIEEDFVVINGKIITNIDLAAAINEHRRRGALATLILRRNVAREHFSIVEVDSSNRITRFAGFPKPLPLAAEVAADNPGQAIEPAPLMFTGIQVLSPRIFEYIPRNQLSHSTIHVYPRAIEAGELVAAHISEGEWYEMSTLARYLDVSLAFMRRRGIKLVSGTGSSIEDGAEVEDCVLWEGATVERGARVREAVLADRVRITEGVVIERAVVVRRDSVREVERGQVVGDNVIVPV
jgi:NDP-sugar pyrophosphorylase family protein